MAETKIQGNAMTMDRFKRPDDFDVILHNDDFTTMEFVVMLLRQVFFIPEHEAVDIMLSVHEKGRGIAGTYIYDIACSKAQMATNMARAEGFPLKITVEPHNPTC